MLGWSTGTRMPVVDDAAGDGLSRRRPDRVMQCEDCDILDVSLHMLSKVVRCCSFMSGPEAAGTILILRVFLTLVCRTASRRIAL